MKNAIQNVLNICERGAVIVIESTVSPGTIDRYVRPMVSEKGLKCGEDVHLAHAPETDYTGEYDQRAGK